jgi:peptide/nickel transport system substrate-binding protein
LSSRRSPLATRSLSTRTLTRRWRGRPGSVLAAWSLAVVAALALAACGSSGNGGGGGGGGGGGRGGAAQGVKLYGSLPPVGAPTHGGTITVSQVTGATPTYIFPIVPGSQGSAYTVTFINDLFLPLYAGPNGSTPEIDYALSLANKPIFSNGDKTVTIPMKSGFKWSDGKPVDANDLVFEIDLLKAAVKESPANWSQYTPGEFPTSVLSATAKGNNVVLQLNKAYNPGFFLNNQLQTTGNVEPLPSTAWNIASAGGPHLDYTNPANAKKIYDYLAHAGAQLSGFASNPLWKVVDGPFKLKDFSTTNSSYDLVPNPSYGGSPKPYASDISVQTYTGITPLLNALRTGSLDVGAIDFSQLGQVNSLRSSGYSVFGYPPFGWFGALINFKDKTNHFDKIISQLYVRQALAHLINQPAYVSGIFKNAAVAAYGPVPSVPKTPYTPSNALTAPYPYSASTAVALLKSHGWKVVPNGQTTCAKPGTASNECGAGIPAGTPFKFTWYYTPASSSPSSGLESEAFASVAKQAAGVSIQLFSKTFNFLISNFNDADPSDAKNENTWGVSNYGGFSYDFFPTSDGIFNTGGVFNGGAYSDPTADKLIKRSVYGSDPNAVTNEAAYLTKDIPIFFMPNSDYVWAVSKKIGGASPSFLALTELIELPQFWYLTK